MRLPFVKGGSKWAVVQGPGVCFSFLDNLVSTID